MASTARDGIVLERVDCPLCACSASLVVFKARDWMWDVPGEDTLARCRGVCITGGSGTRRGLDVHVGTLESARYADASFDAVFAWGAVPHLRDPVATFREVHRILRPGGQFLFSFPNAACWELRFFREFWYGLQVPTQMQHYTPAGARRLLGRTGFEIVELTHLEDINNFIGASASGSVPGCPTSAAARDCTNSRRGGRLCCGRPWPAGPLPGLSQPGRPH